MIKMRLQGTVTDIEQVLKKIEKADGVRVSNVSKPFANYGTLNYFRVYGEIELNNKIHRQEEKECVE